MGTPHPDLVSILARDPFPDLVKGAGDLLTMRRNRAAHIRTKRSLYPIPGAIPAEVSETEHMVTCRDGASIRTVIYTPTTPGSAGGPLIIMLHEGGWSMGDYTDEELNCRMFARDLHAVCVNVEYRLAPEHPFPTGLNDCWDVVQWCARTAAPDSQLLPADLGRGFVVGGSSAGANLAAVLAQMSRDQGLSPPITGQYLSVPSLLWNKAVPLEWQAEYRSRKENVNDPVLNLQGPAEDADADQDIILQALQVKADEVRFSPALHPNLKGLAPAFFQIAGLDPLRDEGLLYDRLLRESGGVKTRVEVYDGFGHM